jgi:hypothetical protein
LLSMRSPLGGSHPASSCLHLASEWLNFKRVYPGLPGFRFLRRSFGCGDRGSSGSSCGGVASRSSCSSTPGESWSIQAYSGPMKSIKAKRRQSQGRTKLKSHKRQPKQGIGRSGSKQKLLTIRGSLQVSLLGNCFRKSGQTRLGRIKSKGRVHSPAPSEKLVDCTWASKTRSHIQAGPLPGPLPFSSFDLPNTP